MSLVQRAGDTSYVRVHQKKNVFKKCKSTYTHSQRRLYARTHARTHTNIHTYVHCVSVCHNARTYAQSLDIYRDNVCVRDRIYTEDTLFTKSRLKPEALFTI